MLDFVYMAFFGVVGVFVSLFYMVGFFFFLFFIIVGEKYKFLDCNLPGPFKTCSLELDDSSD